MIPSDTHLAVFAMQVAVWRRLGPEGRVAQAAALSEALRATVREQLRVAHPDWSPWQLRMGFIERVYGVELAERVRRAMGPGPAP